MQTVLRGAWHAAAGCALSLAAASAQAQAWPQKPMIFLNPFPAGGGTDTFARPIAAKLSRNAASMASERTLRVSGRLRVRMATRSLSSRSRIGVEAAMLAWTFIGTPRGSGDACGDT